MSQVRDQRSPQRSPRRVVMSSPSTPRRGSTGSPDKGRKIYRKNTPISPLVSPRSLSRSCEKVNEPGKEMKPSPLAKQMNKIENGSKVEEYVEVPKLPLPPMSETLAAYLDNLVPLLDNASFIKAKKQVEEFGVADGVGEKAQKLLEERREKMENWAYDYWINEMYLTVRLPLPVNSNPGMVFPKMDINSVDNLITLSSRILLGFTKYKEKLDNQRLPQERAASREPGQPLCMAQMYRLLTTYRRPGIGVDSHQSTLKEGGNQEEHVLVGRRGHWYLLPVKVGGKWSGLEDVYASLTDIWTDAEDREVVRNNLRPCLLTAGNRNSWAVARNEMIKDSVNRCSLAAVENCLMVLCLDEEEQNGSDKERSHKEMFRQMLTGGGTKYNGANRWFDKTVQLIVTLDGVCGICYEHSPSEGIATVQLVESILKGLGEKSTAPIAYHPTSSKFSHLNWNLNTCVQTAISSAGCVLDRLDSDNDLEVFHFHDYGKQLMKSCRCSPDAWLQLSLQLTMFQLYTCLSATYESASTRRYRLGRVDSIRSAHPESLAWCKVMVDTKATKMERRRLLELALKKQTTVMVNNILGHGLDIPLLGLKEATRELGLWDQQEMFSSPAYESLNHFRLSTSQVPVSLSPSYMGYGAVVPDGYGVSYNPYPDSVIFCICSFHSCEQTNSRHFAKALSKALDDMRQLFIK